ncbi:MAG TPA: cysteine hydrolase [Caulobacteraceae bacterium]|jgi:nicotinamidase-related amidase
MQRVYWTPRLPGAADERSWLICLDLQRDYVVPGRPKFDPGADAVAQACDRMLRHARDDGWRIVHAHQQTGAVGDSSRFGAPIDGLRPLVREPIFMRAGLSAFSNPDFSEELGAARGAEVYLIGFSLSGSCLATALAAVDAGLNVSLVEDAVGAGPAAPSVGQIARALLMPWVRLVSSREITAPELVS